MSKSDATYGAHIESIESIAANVLHCRLRADRLVPYEAGQYCMVTVGDTARAFSFATPPGNNELEFLINTAPNGPASRFFAAARAGDSLIFTAPYGDFMVDPGDPRPLLYLAGGVGLAPIMAHILRLVQNHTKRPITLVVGHKNSESMFWDQKLTTLAAEHGFSYQGIVGPLIPQLSKISSLPDYTIYLCGSAGMCTATAEALYQQGVSPSQVHYELFT